ncbi:MAG TPA: hypothetical protein VI094_07615 [Propionibacteriaceae bacterium]
MTALALEHDAVVDARGVSTSHVWRGNKVHVGRVGTLDVLVFPAGGMGNVGAAQAATLAIGVWNPASIMLVGVAAGMQDTGEDLRRGDVIVPTQIIGYELGKIRPEGFERRYEVMQSSWELLQTARGLEAKDWALSVTAPRPDGQNGRVIPRAFFGPVYSGEKVVTDPRIVEELQTAWGHQGIGLEMESFGVALAAWRGGPGFLMAKAIMDFADPGKDDAWKVYAAESAARFAIAVLKNTSIDSEPDRPQAIPIASPQRFSGQIKVAFCRRLADSWKDLADLFEVSPYERGRFERGDEARSLWEWLEVREKLPALLKVLLAIERKDLADLMKN